MRKPYFIKVNKIQPAVHCYNIYGKIIDVKHYKEENKNKEEKNVAEGYIADETGKAHFKILGQYADEIKQDSVVAIRNGKSLVRDGKIRLEIDYFGRVTVEEEKIIENINNTYNISEQEYIKKPKE